MSLNAAIIPAAGLSSRMGPVCQGNSKNLLRLTENSTVIGRTVASIFEAGVVDLVLVCCRKSDRAMIGEALRSELPAECPWELITGGASRQASVWHGLRALKERKGVGLVGVHDGARPFCPADVIREAFRRADEWGASLVAVPVSATLKRVITANTGGIEVEATIDRSTVWEAQTPQVARFDLFLDAFERANEDEFMGTDDVSLLERLGQKVSIVQGSHLNIKITSSEDLELAKVMASSLSVMSSKR